MKSHRDNTPHGVEGGNIMAKASEETTKGLTADKLKDIEGYPTCQNTTVNGITWYKEDSYKGTSYNWLYKVFAKASKKQTLKSRGTPDYTVVLDDSETIIVIECKASIDDHSMFTDPVDYECYGYGKPIETEKYAINGALWYASFLKSDYDVVAVGISGQNTSECKVTSFVWPKGGEGTDIKLLENGSIADSLVSINQYEKDINIVLNRFAATENAIRKELRRYTLSCANFLRSNGIEDNSKAGFVSAIILGLTNHESNLYKTTKAAIDKKKTTKSKHMLTDTIAKNSVKLLKASLYGEGDDYEPDYVLGIWDIDKIPKGKRTSLKKFYDTLLSKDELMQAPKGKDKYFPDGDTVLACCIYSLYENVIEVLEKYSGIDVMGEFYTTFLRFTKGNAKEKGIVLTPKHITELFCDIAEYFLDKPLDEKTKILDICCGTGAFLISSLGRIKSNIDNEAISDEIKSARYEEAQKNSLIGVERDASMYALAYANMRFHGDGKSNLFNCSSLLIDSYAPVDESGQTYSATGKVPLHQALSEFGDIDVGMINPPYSMGKKDESSTQEYPLIKAINELLDKNKKLEKQIKDFQKKELTDDIKATIQNLQDEIKNNIAEISSIENEINTTEMREITIQKGQDELDFIISMLHYIKKGGIGIAIVPMSCAGSSGSKLRSELLKHHTLLACMTMPPQLFFDSHVGAATCIMVFKAHIPHNSSKSVFFGIWKDDGFTVIPHNGRNDSGLWNERRKMWVDQIDGTATPDDTVWLRHKINNQGEALPEAYVRTDFSTIDETKFCAVVRKYSLYKYMDSKSSLEIKDSAKIYWLLDNYNDFEKNYSAKKKASNLSLKDRKWDKFRIGDIITDIHNGKSYNASDLVVSDSDDYVSYITRTDENNGVSMCVLTQEYPGLEKSGAITIGDTTSTIFYQETDFITGPHIIVVRADWLNVYTANFLIALLNMEKFRYPVFGRAFLKDLIIETEVMLPIDDNGNPDYTFMEEYIKSLPYSGNIE